MKSMLRIFLTIAIVCVFAFAGFSQAMAVDAAEQNAPAAIVLKQQASTANHGQAACDLAHR